MAMVTRELNNIDGPITSPAGAALASKQVIFQLVDFEKRQPVSLFDAATGGDMGKARRLEEAVAAAARATAAPRRAAPRRPGDR